MHMGEGKALKCIVMDSEAAVKHWKMFRKIDVQLYCEKQVEL